MPPSRLMSSIRPASALECVQRFLERGFDRRRRRSGLRQRTGKLGHAARPVPPHAWRRGNARDLRRRADRPRGDDTEEHPRDAVAAPRNALAGSSRRGRARRPARKSHAARGATDTITAALPNTRRNQAWITFRHQSASQPSRRKWLSQGALLSRLPRRPQSRHHWGVISHARQQRVRVLEALELRARQFRSREGIWPFRVPHEPLDLRRPHRTRAATASGRIDAAALRAPGTVLGLERGTRINGISG